MSFELTEIKRAQGEASESSRIKSNSKRRWRARKNVFTWLTWIPTKEQTGGDRAGRDHESEAARFPVLIAPQSSEAQLKFPRKFLIRSRYLSRRATGVVRHANVAEFPRAIFLPVQFQRRAPYVSLGNGHVGLTANDKANVILSALRARYRGRGRGGLEPCLV